MKTIYDAIVVGAGLAGSYAAYHMSKDGMKVLVLEASTKNKRKICGEYLCPIGVDLLVNDGFKEDIVDKYLPVYGMKIVPSNSNMVCTDFPATDKKNYGISVNRELFDKQFYDLAEQFGATMIRGVRAVKFVRDLSYWVVTCSDGQHYYCRILIGADGMSSVVAKSFNLRQAPDTSRVALHCHVMNRDKNERYGEMHLFDDGNYIGIDPTGENELNISLVCNSKDMKKFETKHDMLNFYITKSTLLSKLVGSISNDIQISVVTPITNKTIASTHGDVALIGDAAGFIDPLTGEGMYFALWTARTLAQLVSREHVTSLFSYHRAIEAYEKTRRDFLLQKSILNRIFQIVIKWPWLTRRLASYFNKKKTRADIFIGIIGNIYRPTEGLFKLLRT